MVQDVAKEDPRRLQMTPPAYPTKGLIQTRNACPKLRGCVPCWHAVLFPSRDRKWSLVCIPPCHKAVIAKPALLQLLLEHRYEHCPTNMKRPPCRKVATETPALMFPLLDDRNEPCPKICARILRRLPCRKAVIATLTLTFLLLGDLGEQCPES